MLSDGSIFWIFIILSSSVVGCGPAQTILQYLVDVWFNQSEIKCSGGVSGQEVPNL